MARGVAMSGPGLRVYALGGFRVERGADPIPIEQSASRPGRQLFKWLLTRRTRRIPRDEAIELLWPNSDAESASTLRVAIFRLRRVLEPGVSARDSVLDLDADTISIRRDAEVWVDADQFEHLLAEAGRTDDPTALLEEADRLYGGDYLPDDLYDDWAAGRREALNNLWIELQFSLSQRREARGDLAGAILALQRLVEKDHGDERAARALMQMLARHGRRSEALRVYGRLAERLREELDAEPSDETTEVYQLLASRSAVPAVDAGTFPPATPRPETSGSSLGTTPDPRAQVATATALLVDAPLAPFPPMAPLAPSGPYEPTYPFPVPELLVGRQGDLLAARRALERGLRGGQLLSIGAPAGTGKSSLAGSIVERARAMGYLCLAGGSFDLDTPSAYGPIRDALADYLLAQEPHRLRADLRGLVDDLEPLVPELRYHLSHLDETRDRPVPATDASRLKGAIHGCLRHLAQQQPVLLCLDDLHAADGATLETLHYLARQTRRLRLTMIATYRTEEVAANRALGLLLTAFAREGLAQEIRPQPLGREETRTMISALLDGPVSDSLTDALFAVTEGNPLFTEQFALALREEHRIDRIDGTWHPAAPDDQPVPPVVQHVIERRFDRLPPHGRETLTMAAVLGPTFELQPLVVALDADDSAATVTVLDEAIRAQLVYETATGYRFGHAMIRECLYRSATGPHRALLHARAGHALEALAGDRAPERAAELARHFALAATAAPTIAQALHYSLEAGHRAAGLSAYREALDHYARAASFADRSADISGATRLSILEGRARAERELGLWSQCIATCRSLLAQLDDPVAVARTRSTISRALRSLGDTGPALVEVETGLDELLDGGDGLVVARARTRLLYDRSYLLFLQGRFRDAYAVGQQALAAGAAFGGPDGEGVPLNGMILAAMGLNQVDLALQHCDRAVAAARSGDAQLLEAVIQDNAGQILYRAGRFEAATERLQRALDLYGPTAGDVRAINALQTLARVQFAQGRVDEARRQVEQALTHATDGGDRWAAECFDLLGRISLLRGASSTAILSFERALALYERTGDPTDTAECLVGLGLVSDLNGDWPHAEQVYRRAIAVADRADPCPEQIAPRRQLGLLLSRRGLWEAASELLDEACAMADAMAPTIEQAPTLLARVEHQGRLTGRIGPAEIERVLAAPGLAAVIAEAHAVAAGAYAHATGAHAVTAGAQTNSATINRARRSAATAVRLADDLGAPRLLGLAQRATGRVAAASGQQNAAVDAYEAAIRLLEDVGAPYDLAVTMHEYARLLTGGPDAARGHALQEAAQRHFTRLGAADAV